MCTDRSVGATDSESRRGEQRLANVVEMTENTFRN
jgi:hypothetical protein